MAIAMSPLKRAEGLGRLTLGRLPMRMPQRDQKHKDSRREEEEGKARARTSKQATAPDDERETEEEEERSSCLEWPFT